MRFQCNTFQRCQDESAFLVQIDRWVLERITDKPSFGTLLYRLPGVYPTDLMHALVRLRSYGKVGRDYLDRFCAESRLPPQAEKLRCAPIKQMEHPLDFEWMFDWNGVQTICEEVRDNLNSSSATVLCLGCPTVHEIGRFLLPTTHFTLWDKNANSQTGEIVSLAKQNLMEPQIREYVADVVVVDPPWYTPYYKSFLTAAIRSLETNGTVILSVPPIGTRSSAEKDFEELVAWCKIHHLELIQQVPGVLSYRTPLFELNALKQAGITGAPLDWRRGDLLVFRLVADSKAITASLAMQDAWTEFRFGRIRIKIKPSTNANDGALIPVGPSEILANVSSRDPTRSLANVVTSGNRFFHTDCSTALIDCCTKWAMEGQESIPSTNIKICLEKLLEVEFRESELYMSLIDDDAITYKTSSEQPSR